jgi:hypothetical protein
MRSFDDLRVVGFQGTDGSVCGRAFPIVRDIRTKEYFDLSIDEPLEDTTGLRAQRASTAPEEAVPEPDHIYSEDEMMALFDEEELIRLPEEFEEFPARPDTVVAYVTAQFLEAIEQFELSSVIPGHDLRWRSVLDQDAQLWVTCTSSSVAEQAFEHWATFLMEKCSNQLVELFSWEPQYASVEEGRLARLEIGKLCEVALAATQDNKDLKSRVYLLYGATLLSAKASEKEPDRLYNLYSMGVRPDFTTRDGYTLWDREIFYEQVQSVHDRLRFLASQRKPLPGELEGSWHKWLTFIDEGKRYAGNEGELIERIRYNVRLVKKHQGDDKSMRAKAQEIAAKWRYNHPSGQEDIRRLMQRIAIASNANTNVKLDNESLMVLAGEPAFYLLPRIDNNLALRYMSYVSFLDTVEKLDALEGFEHGPIAKQMLQRLVAAQAAAGG